MMDDVKLELSRRNAASVMETVNRQNTTIQEQQKRVEALNNTFSEILQRLSAVEAYVFAQRIKLMGSGPTSG